MAESESNLEILVSEDGGIIEIDAEALGKCSYIDCDKKPTVCFIVKESIASQLLYSLGEHTNMLGCLEHAELIRASFQIGLEQEYTEDTDQLKVMTDFLKENK